MKFNKTSVKHVLLGITATIRMTLVTTQASCVQMASIVPTEQDMPPSLAVQMEHMAMERSLSTQISVSSVHQENSAMDHHQPLQEIARKVTIADLVLTPRLQLMVSLVRNAL